MAQNKRTGVKLFGCKLEDTDAFGEKVAKRKGTEATKAKKGKKA